MDCDILAGSDIWLDRQYAQKLTGYPSMSPPDDAACVFHLYDIYHKRMTCVWDTDPEVAAAACSLAGKGLAALGGPVPKAQYGWYGAQDCTSNGELTVKVIDEMVESGAYVPPDGVSSSIRQLYKLAFEQGLVDWPWSDQYVVPYEKLPFAGCED